MRKNINLIIKVSLLFISVLQVLSTFSIQAQAEEIKQRKIIVFKENVSKDEREELVKNLGGIKLKDLDVISGMSVLISSEEKKNLELQKQILRIDEDTIVTTMENANPQSSSSKFDQLLTWNVDSVDAENVFSDVTGESIKVGIIDSGIDHNHPDLRDNIRDGYNAVDSDHNYKDGFGHGTHVAGIIAASNNAIGVVGVAPKISIYPIKVLNSSGIGHVSDLIEGIDWAIQNRLQVVNMSLGIPTDNQSLHDAVIRANQAGIVQVAAAGNNPNATASYPAAYEEVISVSAIDQNNDIAPFSSTGKIDVCAPGVDIYSTYIKSTYQYMSGTSMAAPHVTGIVALLLASPDKCDYNGDGVYTPEEIQKRLEDTSTDLGAPSKDNIYGSGLVNAYNALYQ